MNESSLKKSWPRISRIFTNWFYWN